MSNQTESIYMIILIGHNNINIRLSVFSGPTQFHNINQIISQTFHPMNIHDSNSRHEIQNGSSGHSAREDADASMQLVLLKLNKGRFS